MTADYTPTTDEIVRYYLDGSRDWFPGLTTSERNERFYRWLAGEHARVLREAAETLRAEDKGHDRWYADWLEQYAARIARGEGS